MTRIDDIALIDSFINDPSIYPDMGFAEGSGAVSARSFATSADHIWAGDGDRALMLFHRDDGCWFKHNLFRASCRGADALRAGRSLVSWFFAAVGASELRAETPLINRKARWFNRQIGLPSNGYRDHPIVGPVECFKGISPCRS